MKDRIVNSELARPTNGAHNISAALFKAVLDASADHIYLHDGAGRYLYASPSGANALGLSPEDMLGKHWRQLGFPAEIMERFDALRKAVLTTGKPVQARTSFPTLAGSCEYDYWILPLRNEQGRIYSTACIAREIGNQLCHDEPMMRTDSGRRDNHSAPHPTTPAFQERQASPLQSSAKAWSSRHHFGENIDSLPLLVSYVDTAERYRFNNKAYTDWFGQSPHAIQGRRVREVIGEAAYKKIRHHVHAALAGTPISFEQVVPYKDAGPRLVRAHYLPDCARDGKIQGFFALVSDITRESGQPEMTTGHDAASNTVAASRLTMVGEMTTEILHEIGQPLTAIAGFSNASLRLLRLGESNQEELRQYLAEIQQQSARARDIVRKLQRFLRSGRPSEAPVEVNRMVRTALRLMQTDIEAQGITVDLRLMPEHCIISADRLLLEQVLVNLIRNAIEAMTRVDMAHRRMVVRTKRTVRHVMITVSDSGEGIPGFLREKIFQPFITTRRDGFGMGLAISRSILGAHGGRIRATNHHAGGATFRISLPIDREQ